ncbi:MAG: hypothetical protein HY512_03065 [Candidatus Aenigmarchaeota archaeon]|nr:hypothetical protein [Candidatus Aenigmarchaeota archaeon]
MQKRKGFVGIMVIGILVVATIFAFMGYRLMSEIINSKAKLNFQINLEQDYSGTQALSILSLISSTGNVTYGEVIGSSVANNSQEFNSQNLAQVKQTVDKIRGLEKKDIPLAVDYIGQNSIITTKPDKPYRIDMPLPGGERGALLIEKKV